MQCQLDCPADVPKTKKNLAGFKSQLLENEKYQIKSRKKEVKGHKKISTGQLKAIKDLVKNKVQKSKQQERKTGKENTNLPKVVSATTTNISPLSNVENNKDDDKKETKNKEIMKLKTAASLKATVMWKSLEGTKSEKKLKAINSKIPAKRNLITKKEKERLKEEMKSRIDNLQFDTFKAKMLDEEIVESIRKSLSALVDKALETLQKVPKEKLKAASMNLQKNKVKLKPRSNPLSIDPTAQFQTKLLKENPIMSDLRKIGSNIASRSKNI